MTRAKGDLIALRKYGLKRNGNETAKVSYAFSLLPFLNRNVSVRNLI